MLQKIVFQINAVFAFFTSKNSGIQWKNFIQYWICFQHW